VENNSSSFFKKKTRKFRAQNNRNNPNKTSIRSSLVQVDLLFFLPPPLHSALFADAKREYCKKIFFQLAVAGNSIIVQRENRRKS
jgi:hypothetical protein